MITMAKIFQQTKEKERPAIILNLCLNSRVKDDKKETALRVVTKTYFFA